MLIAFMAVVVALLGESNGISTVLIPYSVKEAVGDVGGLSYDDRFRLINTDPSFVENRNREYLLAFLSKKPEEDSITEGQLAVLKNDVADRLLNEFGYADDLSHVLLSLVNDDAQGVIWQNYALQKLGPAYRKTANPDLRQRLLDCLVDYATHPSRESASTALLGLYNLSKSGEGMELPEVGGLAYHIATDDDYSLLTQTTAIRVGAGCGNLPTVSYARELMSAQKIPVELRVAVVAALGLGGEREDLGLLNNYVNSSDIRLRNVSRHAIVSIEARRNDN